jgi:dTDP-4-amino-4,6-dideoxygalactose transaminase
MSRPAIEFIDLKAQRRHIGERMQTTILEAVEAGQYILGPQVAAFENQLAAFAGAKHAIGTANGTDALGICLMALGLRPGDAVICPAFTFHACLRGYRRSHLQSGSEGPATCP